MAEPSVLTPSDMFLLKAMITGRKEWTGVVRVVVRDPRSKVIERALAEVFLANEEVGVLRLAPVQQKAYMGLVTSEVGPKICTGG
ncbi:MAG: hypothetical protein EXR54_10015 [Dehalococcoidia bacterium]|nr:hypothetical protein [Dehalococcoidia bacterium]MSQ17867.1 hypothetical protein [Dehalococcoidia bacterium]